MLEAYTKIYDYVYSLNSEQLKKHFERRDCDQLFFTDINMDIDKIRIVYKKALAKRYVTMFPTDPEVVVYTILNDEANDNYVFEYYYSPSIEGDHLVVCVDHILIYDTKAYYITQLGLEACRKTLEEFAPLCKTLIKKEKFDESKVYHSKQVRRIPLSKFLKLLGD